MQCKFHSGGREKKKAKHCESAFKQNQREGFWIYWWSQSQVSGFKRAEFQCRILQSLCLILIETSSVYMQRSLKETNNNMTWDGSAIASPFLSPKQQNAFSHMFGCVSFAFSASLSFIKPCGGMFLHGIREGYKRGVAVTIRLIRT